jgi:hypothetical protein
MTPFRNDDIHIVDMPEDEAPEVVEPPALHYPQIRKEFLLAGHAYFCVLNPKGDRLTYCVRARENKKKGSKFEHTTSYFLRVWNLVRNSYEYVGIIEPTTGVVIPTGQSRFLKGTPEFDVAQWAVTVIFDCSVLAPGFEIARCSDKTG